MHADVCVQRPGINETACGRVDWFRTAASLSWSGGMLLS